MSKRFLKAGIASLCIVPGLVATAMTSIAVVKAAMSATWKNGQEYVALEPKPEAQFYGIDDITESYRNDLANNKRIYSDDMVVSLLSRASSSPGLDFRYISYYTTSVGPIEKLQTSQYYKGRNVFRISFELTLDATISEMYPCTLNYSYRTFIAQDIPVLISPRSTGAEIISGVGKLGLKDDDRWSLNMPEIIYDGQGTRPENLTLSDTNITYIKDNTPEDLNIKIMFDTIFDLVVAALESNYYSLAVKK